MAEAISAHLKDSVRLVSNGEGFGEGSAGDVATGFTVKAIDGLGPTLSVEGRVEGVGPAESESELAPGGENHGNGPGRCGGAAGGSRVPALQPRPHVWDARLRMTGRFNLDDGHPGGVTEPVVQGLVTWQSNWDASRSRHATALAFRARQCLGECPYPCIEPVCRLQGRGAGPTWRRPLTKVRVAMVRFLGKPDGERNLGSIRGVPASPHHSLFGHAEVGGCADGV